MKIYKNVNELDRLKCVLTTGTFDGIHLGHQTIIKRLCEIAKANHQCSTVVTFEPHPQFVIKPNRKPDLKLLTTLEEKIAILEQAQVDRLIIIPFTNEFSQLTSTSFIEDILIKKIGFSQIIIGYDHAFGKDRQGNIEILKELSTVYNFSIIKIPPFTIGDTIISSTKIRKLISQGDIELAARYLGRNYKLKGTVIKGEGRGRQYNIPTANIKPVSGDKLIPQTGIYAGWVKFKGKKYKSVIYIGTKPTFSFDDLSFEVHLFDFKGELYGESLEIEFKTKLRDDQKFKDTESLVEQIELDKKRSLEILINN